MKSVLIPWDSHEDIECPYCGFVHEPEEFCISGYAENSACDSYTRFDLKNTLLTSKDQYQAHFKTGSFMQCHKCKEIFFAYTQEDTRTCSQCPHYKNYKCCWFDVGSKDTNDQIYNRFHCRRINLPPVSIDPKMKCSICKHANKSEIFNLYCSACNFRTSLSGADISKRDRVCMEFEADFEKYKQYKKSFESDLFHTDDEITIPEFDKQIEEEKHGK